MKLPHFLCTLVVALSTLLGAPKNHAATQGSFDALSAEATRNNDTAEGRRYQDKVMEAVEPSLLAAMQACTKSMPNTKSGEPGEVLFVVAKNGQVKRVAYSQNIRFAACVGSKLRSIAKLPPPPHDSYAVGVLVAKH